MRVRVLGCRRGDAHTLEIAVPVATCALPTAECSSAVLHSTTLYRPFGQARPRRFATEPGVARSLPFEKAQPGRVRASPLALSTASTASAASAAPTTPGAPGKPTQVVQRLVAHLDGRELEACAPAR